MSQIHFFALLTLLLLLGGALLVWLRQRLRRPRILARRMASEVHTIAAANASHRLSPHQLPAGFDELARAINALAERYERLLTTQNRAVTQARADLAAEHARLIALIHNLAEGVLLCNRAGEILLYNPHAQALLGEMVGLGRSLFDLLPPATLEPILELWQVQEHPTPRIFVTRTEQGRFVRARISPIRDEAQQWQGFVLTLEDVTRQVQRSDQWEQQIAEVTQELRHSVANLRAAMEAMQSYPAMEPELRQTLEEVAAREATRLSERLQGIQDVYAGEVRACWHLDRMSVEDLLRLLAQRLPADVELPSGFPDLWVQVDSLALTQALADVVARVGASPRIDGEREAGHVRLELSWPDQVISAAQLRAFFREAKEGERSMAEVLALHGGEGWVQHHAHAQETRLTLLLPLASSRPTPVSAPAPPHIISRPEFYDFDLLFRRPQPSPSLAATPLAHLRYAVFDTETTGLDPVGDEIIAIAAVRIVNARLLENERFDQLIRPRRPVPPSSTRIHGLDNDALKDAPPIEEVLPAFHRFVGEAVLVAHNAAFDMRFLQSAEARTGIHFRQPVLDTLLLSALVHPEHGDHSLEAIAARLGVPIADRHTAWGDALITARIFLKLLPLLEMRGIVTLEEAQAASQQTYFARIRY